MSTVRVFISHSSEDRALAERLIDLLRAALNLSAVAIRCTSVDGHGLPGGADTDEQLRREIKETETFIGIVSDASLRSVYVSFELGGRWALGKHLLPLLALGTPASRLGGPLSGINALQADNRSQLHQMVREIAECLAITPESPERYEKHLHAILQLPPAAPTVAVAESTDRPRLRLNAEERDSITALGDAAQEIPRAAANSSDGVVLMTRTHGGTSVQVAHKNFTDPGNPKSEARWRGAVRQLHEQGCLEDPAGKGESFEVTDRGYELAELLEKAQSN